ncbi:translation elongation factor Ts [bacterium]|nr:translation elongation factor Ts [bacterium]
MAISAKTVMELRQKTGAGMMDCKKALAETDGDMDAAVKFLREKGMAASKKREEREASQGTIALKMSDDGKTASIVEVNSETDFVARNEEFLSEADKLAEQALSLSDKAENCMIPVEVFDDTDLKLFVGKVGEKILLNRAAVLKVDDNGYLSSYTHPGSQLGVLIELNGDAGVMGGKEVEELAHDLTLQIAASSPSYIQPDDVPADVIEKEKEIYKNQMRNEGKPEQILEKIATGKLNKFFEDICLLNQPYVKEPKRSVSDRISDVAKAAGSPVTVKNFIRFKVGESE